MHLRYKNGQRKPNNQNQFEIMISGIDQQRLLIKGRIVKVRSFPGATINDMYDYIRPLLIKAPDNVILHAGTKTYQITHQELF